MSQMSPTRAPRGQALVEVLVISSVLLACLTLIRFGQSWSQDRADAAEAIRLHAEWCRQASSNCTADHLRRLLKEPAQVNLQQASTQIAQSQGRKDWASELRALASVSAEQVFSLPDGNPLQVVHAGFEFPQSRAALGRLSESLRLSVIPHDWRAINQVSAADRIREGSEPVRALASAIEASHAPSLYVLMPTTEFLGLDEHTGSIRDRFHRLDPLAPAQSLGRVRP